MKMAYEVPKMRVELFQANEYVNACSSMHYFTGWLSVQWNNITQWFFGDTKLNMLNQNTSQEQYYYKQVDRVQNADGTYSAQDYSGTDPILYLEYSAPYDTFVLYQEAGSASGYYDEGRNGRYTQTVDGSTSLQVNDGSSNTNPRFEKAGHLITPWYGGVNYLDANGSVQNADAWYADHCLGEIEYEEEEGFRKMNS